jgi:hypothetical protein
MLLAVPLLAGVWPLIRFAILQYNARLARLSGALGQEIPTLSPDLPSAWAIAFFASLAVVLGHLLYQTGAPDIVRASSLEQYEFEQLRRFHERPHSDDVVEADALIQLHLDDPSTRHAERIEQCIIDIFRCWAVFEEALVREGATNDRAVDPAPVPQKELMDRVANLPMVQAAIQQARRDLRSQGRLVAHLALNRLLAPDHALARDHLLRGSIMILEHIPQRPGAGPSMPDLSSAWDLATLKYISQHHVGSPFRGDEGSSTDDQAAYDAEKIRLAARLRYVDAATKTSPVLRMAAISSYSAAAAMVVWLTAHQAWSVAWFAGWLPR